MPVGMSNKMLPCISCLVAVVWKISLRTLNNFCTLSFKTKFLFSQMPDYNQSKCPIQCFNLLPSDFVMKATKAQHKHQGSQLKQFFSGTSSAWNVLETQNELTIKLIQTFMQTSLPT